jgi:hypothetical protein
MRSLLFHEGELIRNIDPTGPMPPADASGRIELGETSRIYLLEVLGAAPVLGVCVLSALCWFHFYVDGPLPAQAGPYFKVLVLALGIAGLIGLPAVPYVLAGLIFPRKLMLDERGVRYYTRGFESAMAWRDISEIVLQPLIIAGRYSSTSQTLIKLRSGRRNLTLRPAFGVAPETLAQYLQSQSQAAGAAAGIQRISAQNADFKLVIIIVVGLLAFLASLKYVVPGLMALDRNPFFVQIILHLPH